MWLFRRTNGSDVGRVLVFAWRVSPIVCRIVGGMVGGCGLWLAVLVLGVGRIGFGV